jgi:hypothetical protein
LDIVVVVVYDDDDINGDGDGDGDGFTIKKLMDVFNLSHWTLRFATHLFHLFTYIYICHVFSHPTAAESSLYYQNGKWLIESKFMMLLLSAQVPEEAFDNWARIEGYLRQNSSTGKIPPDEIQRFFAVAETSLLKFQGDEESERSGGKIWKCPCKGGCRNPHPELKREYQQDDKVSFIPVRKTY